MAVQEFVNHDFKFAKGCFDNSGKGRPFNCDSPVLNRNLLRQQLLFEAL